MPSTSRFSLRPIVILETGRPPEALRGRFDDYPAAFRKLLGHEVDTQTFDVEGELPDDPTAFQGVIVTGSPAGAYEDRPWIPPLEAWLRAARGRTRLVGVCFGHQVMAQAYGGRVEKSDRGWGVGLHRYDIVSDEPWMAPRADGIAIPVSHQDQVVDPGPEARVIARCDFTPFGGLAWGEDAISLQCHPEFEPGFAAALVDLRRGRIPDAVVDAAMESLQQPDDRALVGGWLRRFLRV